MISARQRSVVLVTLTASARVRTLLRSYLARLDRVTYRATRGRHTLAGIGIGLPVALVHTVGAKSGLVRTVPLLVVPYGEDFLVLGSSFGGHRDPGWVHNLRAHPLVDASLQGFDAHIVTRELHGDERSAAFEAAARYWPGWKRYQQWASPRLVPVFEIRALQSWPAGHRVS